MKIKLLPSYDPSWGLPRTATKGSVGFDLRTTDSFILPPGTRLKVGTGLCIALDQFDDYDPEVMSGPEARIGAFIYPRSSTGSKGLVLANTVGVIDADYRGEIILSFLNTCGQTLHVERGDRVAQLVMVPCFIPLIEVVEDLAPTERGEGGFGSTGSAA